jgi:uncharacterized protein (TIGR00251 family)
MKTTETKEGTIIEIYVKPNSEKFKVSLENGEIVVRCTEEPVKGKVNKELIKEFTKIFHSQIELVSGATSRQKKLLVKGVKVSVIEEALKT